jgi:hypothetical protein
MVPAVFLEQPSSLSPQPAFFSPQPDFFSPHLPSLEQQLFFSLHALSLLQPSSLAWTTLFRVQPDALADALSFEQSESRVQPLAFLTSALDFEQVPQQSPLSWAASVAPSRCACELFFVDSHPIANRPATATAAKLKCIKRMSNLLSQRDRIRVSMIPQYGRLPRRRISRKRFEHQPGS